MKKITFTITLEIIAVVVSVIALIFSLFSFWKTNQLEEESFRLDKYSNWANYLNQKIDYEVELESIFKSQSGKEYLVQFVIDNKGEMPFKVVDLRATFEGLKTGTKIKFIRYSAPVDLNNIEETTVFFDVSGSVIPSKSRKNIFVILPAKKVEKLLKPDDYRTQFSFQIVTASGEKFGHGVALGNERVFDFYNLQPNQTQYFNFPISK